MKSDETEWKLGRVAGPESFGGAAPIAGATSSLGAAVCERTGLRSPVLVLNRSYMAVGVTDARIGFSMLYLGRARALDAGYDSYDFESWSRRRASVDDETVGTARGAICVPRLLLLLTYNRVPRVPLRLSRRHVYMRDEYTCQYCGAQPGVKGLNLDHVLPRSRGGRSSWENLVTSCRRCNLAKGWSTPEECGMTLRKRPTRPNWTMALHLAAFRRRFAEWEPFLELPAAPAE